MTDERLVPVVVLCVVLVVAVLPAPVGSEATPGDAALDSRTPTAEHAVSPSVPTPAPAVHGEPMANDPTPDGAASSTPTATATPTPASTDSVTLSGTVTRGTDPATGGRLGFVRAADSDGATNTTVGPEGSYDASLAPGTTYRVVYVQALSASGVRSADDSTPDVHPLGTVETPASSDIGRDFTLPEANDLFIEVTNGSEPVENASVELTFDEDDGDDTGLTLQGTTDATGQFLLDGATNPGLDVTGTVNVSVAPPADTDLRSANRRLDVSTDVTERFDLSPSDPVAATATVLNPDGEPASNVTVVWVDTARTSFEESTYVTAPGSADGQAGPVELDSDREYLPIVVQGTHPGDWEEETPFDTVADVQTFAPVAESTDFSRTFALSRAATTLGVQAVDHSGGPVENASVLVSPTAAPVGPIGETDADGRTVIDGREQPGTELASGAYRITVTPNESSGLPVTTRTVYVDGDVWGDSEQVVVGLVDRSTVTGSLTSSTGPVDSGRVVALPTGAGAGNRTADTALSSDGTYRLAPRQDEPQTLGYVQYAGSNRDGRPDVLTLAGSSFSDAQYEVPAVTLPDGHLVTVDVTDEKGAPVEDATVRVSHTGLDGGVVGDSTEASGHVAFDTDAQGRLAPSWYDDVGLELAGNVTVTVTPPPDAGFVETAPQRELQVDGPASLQFELARAAEPSEPTPTPTSDGDDDRSGGASPTTPETPTPDVTDAGLSVRSSLEFGDVRTGSTADRSLVLSNDGDVPVSVDRVRVVSGDDVFTADAERTVIDTGHDERVVVSFAPLSPGPETGTLLVEHDGTSPAWVDLTGTGVESRLAVDPASLSFGDVAVGESATETLTLTNEGDAPVHLGALVAVNASGVDVVTPANTTLAAGESRTLTVRFDPESPGELTGRLRRQGDGSGPDVPLSGRAVAPSLAVGTRTVAFESATAGDRQTRSVAVRNEGNATLTVSDVRFVGSTPDAFAANVSALTVAPGETRRLAVSFTPDSPGTYAATLQLSTDDPTQPRAALWVSNTDTVVETNATRPARNVTTVNVSVENATAGRTVAVNVSTTDAADDSVAVDSLGIDVAAAGDFTLNVSSGTSPTVTNASFDLSDGTVGLGYLRVDHSIPDEDIDGVTFDFRVRKETLRDSGTPPDEVVLHRYSNGTWSKLPTTVVSESATQYLLRAESPGLSDFVVGGEQAKFRLLRALVGVDTVTVGDEVAVRVRITNVGGADGSYTAALLFNGDVVAERDVTVAANGTRQSTFERAMDEPGQYAVRVNEKRAGNVTVELPDGGTTTESSTGDGGGPTARATSAATETESTLFALPGFGVLPATVALLLAAVGLAARRRSG